MSLPRRATGMTAATPPRSTVSIRSVGDSASEGGEAVQLPHEGTATATGSGWLRARGRPAGCRGHGDAADARRRCTGVRGRAATSKPRGMAAPRAARLPRGRCASPLCRARTDPAPQLAPPSPSAVSVCMQRCRRGHRRQSACMLRTARRAAMPAGAA